MKKIKCTILTLGILLGVQSWAQTDWSKVDFTKDYKGHFKIGGASAKSLKKNKTFVAGYTLHQATVMKGSQSSATKSVFSEVSLGGLSNDAYQQMVDNLYKQLMQDLDAAGLQTTEGEDVLETSFVKNQAAKGKKDIHIGSTGSQTAYEGKAPAIGGGIAGYQVLFVKRDVSFQPRNKNIYQNSNLISSGNFYQKLCTKENYNLLLMDFKVTFAYFDGGRGYKDVKLATKPAMAISVTVSLITPNGAINKAYYTKLPVWGNEGWSDGINKTKDNKNDSEVFGLARSADYEITANSNKYITEVSAIISNLQKDMVKNIKAFL